MISRSVILLVTSAFFIACAAQKKSGNETNTIITKNETARIEKVLAADEMRGRKTFSPEIDKAADFIASEFRSAGLSTWNNSSFLQEFSMLRTKPVSTTGKFNGSEIQPQNIMIITADSSLSANEMSGYKVESVRPGDTLQVVARRFVKMQQRLLVIVDPFFTDQFGNLARLRGNMFRDNSKVIFILSSNVPDSWSVDFRQQVTEMKMKNVVGVLPDKSKKNEFVIFSGHYDHIGVGKAVNGDSIYNGANDDASGITGVIMLANYFSKLRNNERTIIFAAFTAEEIGGFGSQFFAQQYDPSHVIAMFNLEMIGTESKWGKNSAYITGYEKTDMGTILAKDLEGTEFSFYPDPYPNQQLFYRSDNATLARLGVPAHTISTSKMDVEPHYHKVSDHVETLDLVNMTEVIKAIALSSKSIIAGTATPTRVRVEDLR